MTTTVFYKPGNILAPLHNYAPHKHQGHPPAPHPKISPFSQKPLDKPPPPCYNTKAVSNSNRIWGYSSAGRALEWHSRGQRFDPAYLHHTKILENHWFSRIFLVLGETDGCYKGNWSTTFLTTLGVDFLHSMWFYYIANLIRSRLMICKFYSTLRQERRIRR